MEIPGTFIHPCRPWRCHRWDVTPKDLARRAATKSAMRRLGLEAVAIVTCPALLDVAKNRGIGWWFGTWHNP